jgi:hypothetical protein
MMYTVKPLTSSTVTTDVDGESRPTGGGYDFGADEVWYRMHLPIIVKMYAASP